MSFNQTPAFIGDILQAACARPEDRDFEPLLSVLRSDSDWSCLVQAALRHGVAGLLCQRLLGAHESAVPADVLDAARGYVNHAAEVHQAGLRQMVELLEAFDAAGITAIPFKGPALAQSVYAEPALRGYRDLDILIHGTDLAIALQTLEARGYQSLQRELRPSHRRAYHHYNGQDILFADGMLPVEPHWMLGQRTLAAPIDVSAIIDRAVPLARDYATVKVLSAEDNMLALAFHGAKHEWTSLRDIVDVALSLRAHPQLDWNLLLERSDAAGVRRIVLLGTLLARSLLDAPVPAATAAHLAADGTIERLAQRIRHRLFLTDTEQHSVFELSALRWRMRERPLDRLHYAVATLITPRVQHFRALDLPPALHFLYPGVKVLHDYVALPLWRLGRNLSGPRPVPRS